MKLEVSKSFTGQYFNPYAGKQYRRMESEGVAVWEVFDPNKNWLFVTEPEARNLEAIYQKPAENKKSE
jgi:hypothetical protein